MQHKWLIERAAVDSSKLQSGGRGEERRGEESAARIMMRLGLKASGGRKVGGVRARSPPSPPSPTPPPPPPPARATPRKSATSYVSPILRALSRSPARSPALALAGWLLALASSSL